MCCALVAALTVLRLWRFPGRPATFSKKGDASSVVVRACVVSVALMLTPAASAAGLIVGPLCLDGVYGTPRPSESTDTPSGRWTPTDYAIQSRARAPRIAIFTKPIPESPILETCLQIEARMLSAGVRPLLAGRMTALELRANIFNGPGGNRVQINPKALKATLVSVDSGELTVAGGTLRFAGSRLWVTTRKTVLTSKDDIEGVFEIEAWDRTISGAKVALNGGMEYRVDLRPRNGGNLKVEIDLASAAALLQKGDLIGKPAGVPAMGSVQLDVLELKEAALAAGVVRVVADRGLAQVTLEDLKGQAASTRIPGSRLQWATAAADVAAAVLQAPARQEPGGLVLGTAVLRKLSLSGESLQALAQSNQFVATGRGTVSAELLSAGQLDLKGRWPAPANTALAAIFPDGKVAPFVMALSGVQEAPLAALELGASVMALGGLELQRSTTLATTPVPLEVGVRLPVDISVPAAKGKVEFKDKDRTVALQGSLDSLELHGSLVLRLDDLEQSRLEVARDQFQLKIGTAVAATPFLAGTRPNFAAVGIGVSNLTDLVVSKAHKGQLLLTTGVIALGEPVFRVGEGGSASKASLTITSEGNVRLLYGLDDSRIILAQGTFRVRDARFKLLGPTPHVLDLNGDLLSEPELDMTELLLEVDKLGPIAIERGRMDKLKVLAQSLERRRKPDQPKALSYSGRVTQPLEVDSLVAAQLKIDDEVALGGLEMQGLRFGLADARFSFGTDARLERAAVSLSAERLRQVQVGDRKANFFTNVALYVDGRMRLSGPDFSVNEGVGTKLRLHAGGPESSLSGSGNLDVDGFTGHARSRLDIGFKCKNSDKLAVPIEYNFGLVGASFSANLREGILSAEGELKPFGFDVHTVGDGAGCNSPSEELVVASAQSGWTWGLCSKNLEVYRCKWEWSTPKIAFNYNIRLDVKHLNAPVVMTNPRLFYRDGKVAFCNVGAAAIGAITFVGGYSPQIETPFGGDGEKLVNAMIAANFIVPQTLIGTSLLNGVGWLASLGATVGGNLMCIGQL